MGDYELLCFGIKSIKFPVAQQSKNILNGEQFINIM